MVKIFESALPKFDPPMVKAFESALRASSLAQALEALDADFFDEVTLFPVTGRLSAEATLKLAVFMVRLHVFLWIVMLAVTNKSAYEVLNLLFGASAWPTARYAGSLFEKAWRALPKKDMTSD